MIRDPGSGIRDQEKEFFRIRDPDTGVKKSTGSRIRILNTAVRLEIIAWCVQAAGYLAVCVAGEPGPPRHPPHPPPLLQAEAHPPRPALTRQYTQIFTINKQAAFII